MAPDFDPFAAAGNHGEDRGPGRNHPHIMLQLRHVLLGGGFLRERPGQHEFGFEYGVAALNPAIERCPHPPQCRVPDLFLDICNDLAGIGLIPVPVQLLSGQPKLDNEIAGQVLRLDLASFFLPKAEEGTFIIVHNDPSIRAADEVAAVGGPGLCG
jgi:hypothetical protein